MKVPLFDAAREFEAHRDELLDAAERVLASGRYVLGPEVEAFESEVAGAVGVRAAVGVASGTDALILTLRALGVGPGDGVVVPAQTFFATASAVLALGATPVVVDVTDATATLDAEALGSAFDRSTVPVKAVVAVHLYGQCADMEAIAAAAATRDAVVVEDAAQAFGADLDGVRAGSLSRAGCFSFFPTKNLGAFGDGGLVATDDERLADEVRALRAHGARERHVHEQAGVNSRLDALQAALLRVNLRHEPERRAARRSIAAEYDATLAELPGLRVPRRAGGRTHTFHQYVVRVAGGRRAAVADGLAELGVETGRYYPTPVHLQPALRHLGHALGDFPAAEAWSDEGLALPIFPSMTDAEVAHVCRAIEKVAAR